MQSVQNIKPNMKNLFFPKIIIQYEVIQQLKRYFPLSIDIKLEIVIRLNN